MWHFLGSTASPMCAVAWFRDVSWSFIPPERQGCLFPADPSRPRPKLLGGSSKLAKLAEERRKKAAATAGSTAIANGSLSALDRLTRPNEAVKENEPPGPRPEGKKYPTRKKREPTPPTKIFTPSPEPEEKPDIRASPTMFGRTLSTGSSHAYEPACMNLKDVLGSEIESDPFNVPSPDAVVIRAQQQSKLLTR